MEHKKFLIPCAGSCCCNLVVYLQLAVFLPHYLCLVFLLYHLQCYCLSRNEHKHNQNYSNCYPTAGSKTMYELQRTIKFYMQSFMFFSRTSSKSSQLSFHPCAFTCTGKNFSVPSLTKNTLICYNIILKAVL